MDLDTVRKAILSLTTPFEMATQKFPNGFPGNIGIMGGEPTSHPHFAEICKIVQELIPDRSKRELWTDGYRYHRYRDIIRETFEDERIIYNDHTDKTVGWHQPLLVAAEEAVEDKELMWRLIGNCWVQWRWSASITLKGGFFCEVAAALDMMFNGPGGYPIEPGWWAKNPNEFLDQVERSCTKCSGAIPMPAVSAHADFDLVSPGNLERLKHAGSPRIAQGHFRIVDTKFTRDDIQKHIDSGWTPWNHRPYKVYGPRNDGKLVRVAEIQYRPEIVDE
ncbi:MAG TPA: radical SAM protein [Candidatus Binatia bacterium]|jgi:hypothetical protein